MSRRDHILSILRAHEADLRARGVARLAIFGSTARGEDKADSDVDLLAVFDPVKQVSLFDLVGLENHLSDLLGVRVDLVADGGLRPRMRERVERDRVGAF